MHRARGPWWFALPLLALSMIAACDHDDDDTTTASDAGAEEGSAGSDDPSNGELAPLTCMELTCPVDQVCVEPRPYCDMTGDEPVLRQDPAECRPQDAVPRMAPCDDLQGVLMPGPDGEPTMVCPEDEIPCG